MKLLREQRLGFALNHVDDPSFAIMQRVAMAIMILSYVHNIPQPTIERIAEYLGIEVHDAMSGLIALREHGEARAA